jgi:hypothetical protein
MPGTIGKAGRRGLAGSGSLRQNGQTYHGLNGYAGFKGTAGVSSSGGLYSYGGSLNLIQVTVAKNSAQQGGGVYINADTTANIDNCTIAFNKASVQGGGLFAIPDVNQDPINVFSTIVAENISVMNSDVAGTLVCQQSLIQNVGNSSINDTSDIFGVSALLGALGFHGGMTETLLPGKTSAAIGAGFIPSPLPPGVTLKTDQRGDLRMINGEVDIGSVEVG